MGCFFLFVSALIFAVAADRSLNDGWQGPAACVAEKIKKKQTKMMFHRFLQTVENTERE